MLQTHRVRTFDQIRSFLDGAEPVEVQPLERSARYEFVARTRRRGNRARPTRGWCARSEGALRGRSGEASGSGQGRERRRRSSPQSNAGPGSVLRPGATSECPTILSGRTAGQRSITARTSPASTSYWLRS